MRFLLDGMLGKLTRWLRILGYDAEYSKNSSDNNLLSQAKDESRIL
ncbi:MAG TPA: Mut7-C RNAse domain-containing protein, partial [Candidatus Bathyarchaeia archaeon]|nr:Mut7-C RNAse domain-containing protein [Candidatus Bathyarchaeia archaeon]